MNSTGISQFNQARIEWAIRLRYSPMPDLSMDTLGSQLNAFRIGELRTIGKTWEIMMERDGELAINSDKRKADSACLEWQIASDGSPDGDKHAAALQYFYNNLTATKALDQDSTGGVDDLIYQVLSAVDYYYSAHEILLRIDNAAAKEITAEFRHTPVWFFEARRGYLGYLKHIFDLYGQPCIAGEFLTAVNIGWMRPLCMAYAAKWFSLEDWMVFCRRYGSGFLEGTTNATQDSKEWNDALATLTKLANEGVVLHNQGVEFKFLEQAARNQLPFQPVVELIDRLYAKCYRGVDLATGSRGIGAEGGGERAGGRNPVGASVQKEESGILLMRDSKWITGVFNDRIDRPVIRYLFNEEPRAWFALLPPPDDSSNEDLQSLQTLVPMGLRVALKEVYKRFRWSVPDAEEPCLTPPAVPAATSIEARGDTQRSMLSPSPLPPGGEGSGGGSPQSDDSKLETENSKLESGNDDAEEQKTRKAQTDENTPIAAGADPARNPGLLAPGTRTSLSLNDAFVDGSSRQMPDTQVDSSAFWSRTALMPKGPDGQTLPMPSLGYAVPNNSRGTDVKELIERHADLAARGLANCRAAQALKREINRRRLEIQPAAPKRSEGGETNSIALSNWEFDPKQPRDRYGKWTAGDNAGNSTTNKPAPTNLLTPLVATPAAQTTQTNTPTSLVARPSAQTTPLNPVQNLSAQVGGSPSDPGGPNTNIPGPPVEKGTGASLRALTTREKLALDFKQLMYQLFPITRPTVLSQKSLPEVINEGANELGKFAEAVIGEIAARVYRDPQFTGNISAFLERRKLPIDAALRDAAAEQQFRGEIPIATVMGRISEQLAASLPIIAITKGLPPGTQQLVQLGFIAQMVKGAPETFNQLLSEFAKPSDQRNPDKIDSLVSQGIQTLGFTAALALGMMKSSTPEEPPAKIPAESGDIPEEKPPEVPSPAQTPEPSPAPKLPLTAAEHQALQEDIQQRNPISMDTVERANEAGGVNIPKGYVPDIPNNRFVYKGTTEDALAKDSTAEKSPAQPPETEPAPTGKNPGEQTSGAGTSTSGTAQKVPLRKGEITTYKDFKDRSVKGDNLEGHELWQHSNIKTHGLATKRLSTDASKQNPVIVLDKETHKQVTVAQRSIDASSQTPTENISANAKIMRNLGAADNKSVDRFEQIAKQHSEKYIKPGTHEPQ